MISVICPTYRNPKYLDLFLQSCVDGMTLDHTEIIIVVDGFVDESEAILQKYKDSRLKCIPFAENHGMQYAINAGVMQASNPWVLVLNDDNVMPASFDMRLMSDIHVLHTQKLMTDRFILTVNQVEPTGPGMFYHHVKDFGQTLETFQYDNWISEEVKISQHSSPQIEEDTGRIFPFIIAKKYYLAMGGMDTFFNSPNYCDWDFFLRFELMGFKFPRTYGTHLYHFGSVVTKKNSEAATFAIRQEHAHSQYKWKWGIDPVNYPYSNSKLPHNGEFRGFTFYNS